MRLIKNTPNHPPIEIVIIRAQRTPPVSPSATVHTDDDTDQYRSHEQRDSYAQAHNVFIGF